VANQNKPFDFGTRAGDKKPFDFGTRTGDKKPFDFEEVDVGTGLPEQFTEEEETTDISFSDDWLGWGRQNIVDPFVNLVDQN
tara:strand:+ start:661 stop:906 length:246 start_codon:yes stop_codon:yes gene_type:complete